MIELSNMVDALREQLSALNETPPHDGIVFDVGPVELELDVTTEIDGQVKGGVKFLVVTLGSEGGTSRSQTQKLRLTLTPRKAGGTGPLTISDPEASRPE